MNLWLASRLPDLADSKFLTLRADLKTLFKAFFLGFMPKEFDYFSQANKNDDIVDILN